MVYKSGKGRTVIWKNIDIHNVKSPDDYGHNGRPSDNEGMAFVLDKAKGEYGRYLRFAEVVNVRMDSFANNINEFIESIGNTTDEFVNELATEHRSFCQRIETIENSLSKLRQVKCTLEAMQGASERLDRISGRLETFEIQLRNIGQDREDEVRRLQAIENLQGQFERRLSQDTGDRERMKKIEDEVSKQGFTEKHVAVAAESKEPVTARVSDCYSVRILQRTRLTALGGLIFSLVALVIAVIR